MCRWLERDPAGYQDGPSLYAYLGRNPMAGMDPYGLAWWNPLSWGDESEDEQWLEMMRRNAEGRKQLLLDQASRGVIPCEQARREIGDEQSELFRLSLDLELSRAQQDSEAQDVLVGFGDGLSFGITYLARWGLPGGFDEVDTESSRYQIGNAVGTAVSFVLPIGAAANSTRGAASSANASRVFFTGSERAAQSAVAWAEANGAITLTMTREGRLLDFATGKLFGMRWLPNSVYKLLWSKLSAHFARGAQGQVHVFISTRGATATSIYFETELPILLRRGIDIIPQFLP